MSATVDDIAFLRSQGLTQIEIARRSGVPQCRISRWGRGEGARAADDAIRIHQLALEMRNAPANQAPAAIETGAGEVAHG